MSSNDIQIAGNHYQKRDYQHWDFVCDVNLHYLIGNATKYIARWRDKNGVEDLRKALHYISKAVERDVETHGIYKLSNQVFLARFCKQLEPIDKKIIEYIVYERYDKATKLLNEMIADIECGADSSYTNQDPYWRG